ncbi:MAG: hypothetical protein ACOCU0_03835 [Bacillota bacterium]
MRRNPISSLKTSLKHGFHITLDVLKYIKANPKILVPVIGIKVLYVGIPVVLFAYTTWLDSAALNLFNFEYSWEITVLILYLIIVYFRFFETLGASYSLELIRQNDMDGSMSLSKGFGHLITQSLLRVLPIIFIWSALELILKFIIAVIKGIIRSLTGRRRSMAESGADLTGRVVNNALRLGMLMALPMVVWEKRGPVDSIKDGFDAFETKAGDVFSGMGVRMFFYALMFIPALFLSALASRLGILNAPLIIAIAAYMLILWSLDFLVEILFSTKIYLWYSAWQKKRREAFKKSETLPLMDDIEQPSFLSGYSDLYMKEEVKASKKGDSIGEYRHQPINFN